MQKLVSVFETDTQALARAGQGYRRVFRFQARPPRNELICDGQKASQGETFPGEVHRKWCDTTSKQHAETVESRVYRQKESLILNLILKPAGSFS